MKVKVLKRFQDKHTKEIHKVDDEMEVTKERFAEILEKGKLVEELPEEPAEELVEELPEEPAEELVEELPEEPAEGTTKKTNKKATKKA